MKFRLKESPYSISQVVLVVGGEAGDSLISLFYDDIGEVVSVFYRYVSAPSAEKCRFIASEYYSRCFYVELGRVSTVVDKRGSKQTQTHSMEIVA